MLKQSKVNLNNKASSKKISHMLIFYVECTRSGQHKTEDVKSAFNSHGLVIQSMDFVTLGNNESCITHFDVSLYCKKN